MKEKPFRKLEISKFFKNEYAAYIEKWLLMKQDDELVSTIYFTVRELYTFIKSLEVPISVNNQQFLGKKSEKVPRFDRIIADAKEQLV